MNGQNTWTGPVIGGGSVTTGFMTASAVPTPPLAGVPSALAGVDATTQELAKTIAAFADRLDRTGALRPSPPSAAANSQAAPPNFQSSLANSLDQQRMRLTQMISALTDLQDRIDL